MEPDVQLFDPDTVVWNEYSSMVGCTAIPPNTSDYVEQIVLRTSPTDHNRPNIMVFFDDDSSPGSPRRTTSCNRDNIVFIIWWYDIPNSYQMYFPIDRNITHFAEVNPSSNFANYINSLQLGYEALQGGDILQRNPDNPRGWEELRDDVKFAFPEYFLGYRSQDGPYVPQSESATITDVEYIEEPGAPLRQSDPDPLSRLNSQPQMGAGEEGIGIQNAPGEQVVGQYNAAWDPYLEMYRFERTYPHLWLYLIQQFTELRDAAMATGLYFPIPQGLRHRYSVEQLDALGLTIDPAVEEAAQATLANARRNNPEIYYEKIPPIFQMFTGEDPGIFDMVLAEVARQAINQNQGMAPLQQFGSQGNGNQNNLEENGNSIQSEVGMPPVGDNIQLGGNPMALEPEQSIQQSYVENSNIDPNAECLIQDVCLEDIL
ncbi:hypothetical protein TWF730_008450 [Orbilia blumenaviensis]|uniref:Uncharacterized protein n=1 Tax=Orbilia blumenaviensis TaxID=1796055 RepID=A0AAV9V363_9PEZI